MLIQNKNLNERRVAKIKISTSMFSRLLKGELVDNVTTNAPKDLEVIGAEQTFPDYLNGNVDLFFTSSENASVPNGKEPPYVEPFEYTVNYPEEEKNKDKVDE